MIGESICKLLTTREVEYCWIETESRWISNEQGSDLDPTDLFASDRELICCMEEELHILLQYVSLVCLHNDSLEWVHNSRWMQLNKHVCTYFSWPTKWICYVHVITQHSLKQQHMFPTLTFEGVHYRGTRDETSSEGKALQGKQAVLLVFKHHMGSCKSNDYPPWLT